MGRRKRRGERYIDRWLREHVRLSLYLDREAYGRLEEAASSRNMTVRGFLLSLVEGFGKGYEEARRRGLEEGYARAVEDFVKDPHHFRGAVRRRHPKAELALFEAPCSVCGKPMVFTHKDRDWATEVRPALLNAFRRWLHTACKGRGSA
jgi:hypothetical protein